MTDTSKPIVRLETSSPAKKAQKKAVAEAKEQTIKLAIRLNEGINEALRTLIRYRGDLSTMALEALDAVDLTRAALVSAEERMVRDTTITMPRVLHKKLKKIADDRDSSMNILVNTALAHWLAKKGSVAIGIMRHLRVTVCFRMRRRSTWKGPMMAGVRDLATSSCGVSGDRALYPASVGVEASQHETASPFAVSSTLKGSKCCCVGWAKAWVTSSLILRPL